MTISSNRAPPAAARAGRPRRRRLTELLYLQDSYLRAFDAAVVATEGSAVALNRTAFYPGGGGQPADMGSMRSPAGETKITEMRRDGETVWHVLDGPAPAAGTAVSGTLDWERRYAIMRYHSALHILVAAVYRLFGSRVTGGAIYPDRARMDFTLEDLSKDRVASIEEETNRVIAEERRILVRFVDREEFERSDFVRLARDLVPRDLAQVRVIEIEGYDAQADGGT